MISCPLCKSTRVLFFFRDQFREYMHCRHCDLVFVPPRYHMSEIDERRSYDFHRNDPDCKKYRQFLSKIFHPVSERLVPGAAGLDFGSGPGPALSRMFQESGYRMTLYDKFYAPDPQALNRQYDFITATEVVEHLKAPMDDLQRLYDLLPVSGILAIMTRLLAAPELFETWYYKHDLTHICFFSRKVFIWISEALQCDVEFIGPDVILLTRGAI